MKIRKVREEQKMRKMIWKTRRGGNQLGRAKIQGELEEMKRSGR
jgi:hypothetical protein